MKTGHVLTPARPFSKATAPPPRFDDLPELVLVEEAAAFLRIGRNTAYELVKSGALRSVRHGRVIRIPKQALLEGSR
jgi:excisionase family DNA binding protein